MEALSLMHTRMRAALDGMNAGATFAEGHKLDADHAARVPRNLVGTMLSRDEAAALLDRIPPRLRGLAPRLGFRQFGRSLFFLFRLALAAGDREFELRRRNTCKRW
jgi:hypothetical protein